jgi:hypothetical protein
MELIIGSKSLATTFFSSRCKVTIVLFLATVGFMPIVAFPLLCTHS